MGFRPTGSVLAVTLGALLVLSSAPIAKAGETPDLAPPLRVERSRLDLGTVRAGDDVVATFVFRNDGDQAVKIIRAKPS